MTYIPMQQELKETNTLLLRMARQLKAMLSCLSSMSGLNIKEEDVT